MRLETALYILFLVWKLVSPDASLVLGPDLPCKKSGFCSKGLVQGTSQNVCVPVSEDMPLPCALTCNRYICLRPANHPASAGVEFIQALEQISFKKEIIFTISDGHNAL